MVLLMQIYAAVSDSVEKSALHYKLARHTVTFTRTVLYNLLPHNENAFIVGS